MHVVAIKIPVLSMLSRKSGHEIFCLGKRDFTKPLMIQSSISSNSLNKILRTLISNYNNSSIPIDETGNKLTFSGSYVRSLFNKSNPASVRTGDPVNEVAGNFLRKRLYLKQTGQ